MYQEAIIFKYKINMHIFIYISLDLRIYVLNVFIYVFVYRYKYIQICTRVAKYNIVFILLIRTSMRFLVKGKDEFP